MTVSETSFADRRAIFFDLDGTVIDSQPGIVASYNLALAELGRGPLTAAEERTCVGPPLREFFRQAFPGAPIELIERGVKLFRAEYGERRLFDYKLYPGISELMLALRERGRKVYILTAKLEPFAQRIVTHSNLAIDRVFGVTADGGVDDKALRFQQALAELGVQSSTAVLIGDRDNDLRAARAVGAAVIGVSWGYGKSSEIEAADLVVDSVGGLGRALEN